MPGAIRTCFLCGQSNRGPQSLYMIIDCAEQERRIRDALSKRYKAEFVDTVINREVHRQCYRSLVQRQPLARVRSVSHPRKYCSRMMSSTSQLRSKSMFTFDSDIQCADAEGLVDNVSSGSSSSVNSDQENQPRVTENKNDQNIFESESCIGLPHAQHSTPFRDLTNVQLIRTVLADGANRSSLYSLDDADHLYSRPAMEQPQSTSQSNRSTENIVIDAELDETNLISQLYSSDVLSPIMMDSNPADTVSTSGDVEQKLKTIRNSCETQSSIEITNANIDWNDDSWIDIDFDNNFLRENTADRRFVGSQIPFTSTEKTVRATHFNPVNHDIIDTSNFSDPCIGHQGNTRNSTNLMNTSRNNQRKKRHFECSGRKDRSFNRLKRCHRSRSSTVEIPQQPIGECDAASRLFTSGFDELCEWLFDLLEGGSVVPLVEIAAQYERILCRRKETSDVSTYVRMAMSTSHVWTRASQDDTRAELETCESMMNTIEKLRQSIRKHAFLFRKFAFNRLSIADFDESLFWSCVPLLLKNFIGLLTLSEQQFQKIKANHGYYDLMTKDFFNDSPKSLKIASISYDVISAQDEKAITPKQLLLANEIFHHTRSAKLLKMTSRLGHTCGYDTILRLHQEAAEKARESSNLVCFTRQQARSHQHNFLVKVADNFDYNPDGIHGNINNIHILNQILVSTTENDETSLIVQDVLINIVNNVVEAIENSSNIPITNTTLASPCAVVSTSQVTYSPFIDESFKNTLLGYGLVKLSVNTLAHRPLPLLSGFFATYLPSVQRSLHIVSFLTPINENPSSESTAEACLLSTKETLLDSKHQNEAVLVVDEKIYRSCVKVKRRCSNLFDKIFIYAGDFHLMKNTMIVIWDVLEGSGIEDILGVIYKGASLRSVLNVHHFNKSLRCCKLVYTGLLVLLLESFFAANNGELDNIEPVLKELPNEFAKHHVKQKWFSELVDKLQAMNLHDNFRRWCVKSAKDNATFRLWSSITFSLFEPLIELYTSIRMCNFDARNGALSRLAPLFFSTNHRNYARLCAQHLMDLKMSSPYLLDRLAHAFAVNRTNRPFSFIALDQTIECTINKYGKSHGGIDGRFNEQTIDQWVHSFSFRALASAVMHDICHLQTAENSLDSHVECGPQRQDLDNQDLTTIIRSLRSEDLFNTKNSQCRKLRSGMLFHVDIVESICTLHERGSEALIKYIDERLIDRTDKIDVDAPLKAMPRLKFIDADSYVPNNPVSKKKNQQTNMAKIIKEADEEIRRVIIITQQRQLSLTAFLAHEFGPTSLALCDSQNSDLINQQSKAVAINYIRELYPSAFHSSYPTSTSNSALVIDGGSLLETKPFSTSRTIRDYAEQLLKYVLGGLFKEHKRIDVVFDAADSKVLKIFTKRHEHDANTCCYQLKDSDKLESPFSAFVHSNRAALASCVRQCWCQPALIKLIPPGSLLVVGGPEKTAVKLQNGLLPLSEDLLESNHIEADTRMMLHMNIVKIDGEQKTVVIQSSDTDVALLTIAFGSSLGMDNVFIKSFDTRKKQNTIVDAKAIANDMKRRLKIDPIVLLILHALSGCDTTSFVKNITKKKIFSTYLNNPARYSELVSLVSTPPPKEAILAAEQLLIDCYSSRFVAYSLDELRGYMASHHFKERGRKSIITNLPPSSTAFRYHCLRVSRQVVIWLSSFEQYMDPPAMALSGYQPTEVPNRFKIQWTSLPAFSDDPRLVTCGQCSSGCLRCKCGTNMLSCTILCQCKADSCINPSNILLNRHLPNLNLNASVNSDEGSDVATQWLQTSEEEDDDELARSTAVVSDHDWSDSSDDHGTNGSVHSNNYSMSTSFRNTTAANGSSILHISLDHDYCNPSSNDSEQVMTPKRRKRCDDNQSPSPATSLSKMDESPRAAIPTGSKPTSLTIPQSPIPRSPLPKARFLKHFRARLSSSNT